MSGALNLVSPKTGDFALMLMKESNIGARLPMARLQQAWTQYKKAGAYQLKYLELKRKVDNLRMNIEDLADPGTRAGELLRMGLERAEIIVKGVFGVQGSGFWEYHKAHFKILVDCFKMTGLMQIAQDAIQKATQEAVSAHRQAQQTLGLYQPQGTAFQPNGNCLQAFQDSTGSAITLGWFLNAYLVPPLSDQGLQPEAASSLRKLAERYRETHELCERAAHELSSMIAALQVTIGVIRLLEKEATRAKAKIDASKGKAFGAGIASMGVERAQQFAALDAEMNNVNSDDLTGELVNDMNACDKAIAGFFQAYAQFETDFAKILFRQM